MIFPDLDVEQVIQQTAENIVRLHHPEAVILFGLRAYGTPAEDSDIDLLVVADLPGTPVKRAARIYREARVSPWPMDVKVRTAAELQELLSKGDPFLREAVQKGRYLFGSQKELGLAKICGPRPVPGPARL